MKNDITPVPKPDTPYGLISRYRGELMGFATLWIVFYHAMIRIPQALPDWLYQPLYFFKNLGYGGVDIFLLVSGIGIYQSLSKNSVSRYYKNRLSRIYPIWGAYLVLFLAVFAIFYHQYFSMKEIIGYITFFGNWSPALSHQGNWYVYTIMLFYLIAPIPFFLLRDSKHKTLTLAVMIAAAVLGASAFFSTDRFLQKHYLIALTRVPIFFVGMYFSAALKEKTMKALDWILCIAGFVIGVGGMIFLFLRFPRLLWPYGLWWFPFILIAPTMSLLLSKLFCLCERAFRHWHAALRYLGKASLEIFLISNFIFARVKSAVDVNTLPGWKTVLITLGAIAAGILFHILIQLGTKAVKAVGRR